MDVGSVIQTLAHVGLIIAITGFVVGSILENDRVRLLVNNFWFSTTSRLESTTDVRANSLEIAESVFEALYHRKGKLSFLKLLGIVVMFNGLFVYAVYLNAGIRRVNPAVYLFVALVFALGALAYEYIAYKITRYFLRKSRQKNDLKYLSINLLTLPLVVYGVPALFLTMGEFAISKDPQSWLGALILPGIFSPVLPLMGVLGIYNSNIPTNSRVLMAPSALSFCFPVALTLASITALQNKRFLALLAAVIESVSSIQASRIKRLSWGLLSLIGAIRTAWGS